MGVGIYRKIYLFIVCLILVISSSTAESDLYDLIVSKMDIIEVNLAGIKEDLPYLYSLFENRNVSIHTPDSQIVGIIFRDGQIINIVRGEPEETAVDILTDLETLGTIKNKDDFLRAWSDGRIKVIFRNPITDNPVASTTAAAAGIVSFGFFYYFTGNYFVTKKYLISVFSMAGIVRVGKKAEVKSEIASERIRFCILGIEGKGYKPQNNHARLLIGHSYLLTYKITPLKEFKQIKIKIRYDDSKLKIDKNEYSLELPATVTHHISTRTEGLPEMQLEATDFLLFDVEWTDGIKEEGIIQIPISINRNVFDGISYPFGNAFQWFGGLVGVAILFVSNLGTILGFIMNLFTILKSSLNF